MSSSFCFPTSFMFHNSCLHPIRGGGDLLLPASEMSVFFLLLLFGCSLIDKYLLRKHENPFLEDSFISLLLLLLFISKSACWFDLQSPASGSCPPWPHHLPLKDRCCLASSASRAGCRWLHPAWGYRGSHSPQSEVHRHGTEERRAQVSWKFLMAESNSMLRSDKGSCCGVSYRGLSCRQTPFPADVYEARCDNDGANRTNNHQNHKEFAVVTAFLTGREGAADGCAVVLDANLSRQRLPDDSWQSPVQEIGNAQLKHVPQAKFSWSLQA